MTRTRNRPRAASGAGTLTGAPAGKLSLPIRTKKQRLPSVRSTTSRSISNSVETELGEDQGYHHPASQRSKRRAPGSPPVRIAQIHREVKKAIRYPDCCLNTKRGRVNRLPELPSTRNPKEEAPALFGRFLAPDLGFRKLC